MRWRHMCGRCEEMDVSVLRAVMCRARAWPFFRVAPSIVINTNLLS